MIEKINIEMIDLAVKKALKSGTTKESIMFEKDNDKGWYFKGTILKDD